MQLSVVTQLQGVVAGHSFLHSPHARVYIFPYEGSRKNEVATTTPMLSDPHVVCYYENEYVGNRA